MPIFDKALELRNVADGAEAGTGVVSETGIALPVRFLPICDWVIFVTALDAASADEVYVFTLEISDAVGGTYTQIAEHNWPRAKATGSIHIPVNGDMASFADTDAAFARVSVNRTGTTPSITYGSFLTKTSNKAGIASKPGDTVTFP